MDFDELVELIECVACHKCDLKTPMASRCATCEIGYRFISEMPLQLSCSHVICSKCKTGETVKCSRDGLAKPSGISNVANRIINKKKGALLENLRDKVKLSFQFAEGIR